MTPANMEELLNVADYEARARESLDPAAYDYYAGAAGDERTLAENRRGFERVMLRPRVLVDVSSLELATEVVGHRIEFPVILAPTAFNGLAHPDGELAAARAAGAAGTIMVASTMSNSTLEDIARAAGGPLWFQLYVYKDRALTERLVRRVEAAGFQALVLTVDTPRLGRRERDLRNRFVLPPELSIGNFEGAGRDVTRWPSTATFNDYVHDFFDPSLTWDAVAWLQSLTRLPVLLKGILRAEDAERAAAAGVAGIIVSNHGGRQLDGAVAAIRALPEVAEAAGGRTEILLDGGVRRGADVLKAVALGARAVLIGRPYLWGLAVGGEAGVRDVLEILRRELGLAMALSGTPTIASVDASLVVPVD